MYILVRTWVYMDVNKAGCILVGGNFEMNILVQSSYHAAFTD